jgi:hypothetical protein
MSDELEDKIDQLMAESKAKFAALEAEFARISAEYERLKAKVEPKPFVPGPPQQKSDPTEGMSMPLNAILEMARVTPDSLLAAIAREQRPNPPSAIVPEGPAPQSRSVPVGGSRHIPLESPPGMAGVDRVAEAFDRIDRVDMAKRILASKLPEVKP